MSKTANSLFKAQEEVQNRHLHKKPSRYYTCCLCSHAQSAQSYISGMNMSMCPQ